MNAGDARSAGLLWFPSTHLDPGGFGGRLDTCKDSRLEHLGQELLKSRAGRCFKKLLGRPGFDYPPAVHEVHRFGHSAGESHLVGHHEHRHPLTRQVGNRCKDALWSALQPFQQMKHNDELLDQ